MKVGDYGGHSEAQSVGSLVGTCLREMGLASALNEHKVFEAWDSVSGAARHTIGRHFRGGTLYVRLSSSVMRSELHRRLDRILDGVNAALVADETFTRKVSETRPVKKIILQ